MKLAFVCLIGAVVVALHQAAYHLAFDAVRQHGGAITVTSFLNVVEVWNSGVSFGMFNKIDHGKWVLSGVALLIIGMLLNWLRHTSSRGMVIGVGLTIGGAVGNIYDRLRYGAVADYLDFHAFGYHWPAFNLTDSAIFVGVCLILLNNIRSYSARAEQP